jgi:formylglycine-generating enzyme required for sulfatase activity
MMGSPKKEKKRYDVETLHKVTISKPFYLQTTPVTQGQWEKVMGATPSHFKGDDNLPVENVSWFDVQELILKLNTRERTNKYRLPTEAEWEYACRAGSTTAYCFGADAGRLSEDAWYVDNSGDETHPVGRKKPNTWGLYDMHGNVWEWVQDYYGNYTSGHLTDPKGPPSALDHVNRGGSWMSIAKYCRSASRGVSTPGRRIGILGFRLLRTL